MAYQIEYTTLGTAKYISKIRRSSRYSIFLLAAIILLSLLVWSSGGDWSVTKAALETMADNLAQGDGLQEAFTSFCIEILQGA